MKILPLILGKFDTAICVYAKCTNETESYDIITTNSRRQEFTKLVRPSPESVA